MRVDALTVIVSVQFVAMMVLAVVLGTWHDEEYTLTTTAHGAAYAVARSLGYELQPPLYFLLIALVRDIAPAPLWSRMVSVLCALGVTVCAAAIARRVWPQVAPWRPAALFACNPFVVFAAVEIRLYALALFTSALLWLTFYDGFFAGSSRLARGAFVVLAIAALYLQYFLGFELLGFAMALLIRGRFRSLAVYVGAMFACGIAFIPMLGIVHAQANAAFAVPDSKPGPAYSVFLHPIVDFLIPYGYGGLGPVARVLNAGLVLAVVLAVVPGRLRLNRQALALVAIPLTIEAIYIFLADVLGDQLAVPRHFIALFVPETAAAYVLLGALTSAHAVHARRTIAALVALATALSLGYTYRALAKQGDWPRVGAFLDRHARAGDTIAIFPAPALPAFERYYRGRADVVAFPRAQDPNVYSIDRMMVHSKIEAERALGSLPQNGHLWLVEAGTCDRSDTLGCRELDEAVRERYRFVQGRTFFENVVEQLVRKST